MPITTQVDRSALAEYDCHRRVDGQLDEGEEGEPESTRLDGTIR